MTEGIPAVELRNVTAGYSRDHPAVSDVNLSVEKHGFLAVIGPNGGGKTTLMKVICGLMKPFSGSVTVFGKNPSSLVGTTIGYVPQVIPVKEFPATVLDVVLMGRLGHKGLFRSHSLEDVASAREKLDQLGVLHLDSRRMDRLSGGQKQRVLIARALAGEPELLLLDEPLASVDGETQNSFYDLLAGINHRVTIIMVTHDVGAVSSHVRSIACINRTLYSHGDTLDAHAVSGAYGCPFELVTHGVPHRVLEPGANDRND
jgi:zinc transport system ATP-binding protein